jgi:hypothetical protein
VGVISQAKKAGLASGKARQNPKLIADKISAAKLHEAGKNAFTIGKLIGRKTNEIRRWLITAGIYQKTSRQNYQKRVYKNAIPDHVKIIVQSYFQETKQAAKFDDCNHWIRHKEIANYRQKKRNNANKEAYLKRIKKYNDARSPEQIIRQRIAARIRKAMRLYGKGARKHCRTHDYIGCTIKQFREHIQKLFQQSMTWDNYGQWHLDHIIPCKAFDLSKPDHQYACFHWTNLQPLWAIDNIRKSAGNW